MKKRITLAAAALALLLGLCSVSEYALNLFVITPYACALGPAPCAKQVTFTKNLTVYLISGRQPKGYRISAPTLPEQAAQH